MVVMSLAIADLLEQLGGIPANRIVRHPPPGTATEDDVLGSPEGERKLCELVDGTLVEKAMGYRESVLAAALIRVLGDYLARHKLGILAGDAGTLRLAPGLVRIPDISFVSWDRLPDRRIPEEPMPDITADLAVEILSKGNTKAEMDRKLREFFQAGTRLAWLIDPKKRTIKVYDSADHNTLLTESDCLDGGAVLPEFKLELKQLFACLDETGPGSVARS
jgi:Uma2 family endonuclease